MRPAKVLFVDFYSFLGGGQVNLLSVFKALDRKRYQPLLVLPMEGPFAERARELDVPVFISPMGKARWRLAWQAFPAMMRLEDLMRREGVNLVHANCYPALKLAGPAAQTLGIPVLWHKQIAVTQKPGSTTGWLWKRFSRYASRVLAVSKQGFEGLKALGIPEAKLRLMYNNADIPRFAKAKPNKGAWPGKGARLLAAGMHRPHKGFDILLKALPLMKRPAHLVLLGDEAASEPAHELALKSLARAVAKWATLKPAQKDLAPWLKRCEVFVSSSRWEGSPLTVIEAMAAGCAMVATRQGSGEILESGRTGWLVESESPSALAAALDEALYRPAERKRRGAAAAKEAAKRFSLAGYVKDLMGLYEEMLGEARVQA